MTGARRRGEDGAAVVVVIALAVLLVFVGAVAVGTTALVLAHRRAQTAADLAALAAALAVQRGDDACGEAAAIALRHDASVTRCVVEGSTVAVATTVLLPRALGGAALPARARAGSTTPEALR